MVMDLGEATADDFRGKLVAGEDYKHEAHVAKALQRLGHRVRFLGIWNDVDPLIKVLKTNPPDIVFVMCESFAGKRGNEDHVIGILQMYDVPYTGGSPQNLSLCRDKALTKKVLAYHGLRVPNFAVFPRDRTKAASVSFFPAICKPLGREASEGIALSSLVKTNEELEKRVIFLHKNLQCDVIVEEFVSGDEYYVGVLGNQRLTVFTPQILKYKKWPKGKPQIFSYKAKWDNTYRKRWGIDSTTALNEDPAIVKQLTRFAKEAYRCLGLSGYARLDLRLDEEHRPVLIEANPNPGIAKDDDFALSAYYAGWSYDKLIAKIVRLGFLRHAEQADHFAA